MINGITFDEQYPTAANDGHIRNLFAKGKSGITKGCAVTHDSANLYIASGYMIIKGRQVQIVGTQTVPLESVSSGELFCIVVFQIDLTKTNTEESFLQGTIETLKSASGYPSLTQQDIDNGGNVYQYPIARYHVTNTGIDSFTDLTTQLDTDWMSRKKITLDTQTATLYIDLT